MKINSKQREAILDALRERAPRAVHVSLLCSRAGIPRDERESVVAVLDAYVTEGKLSEMPGLRYRFKQGTTEAPAKPAKRSRDGEESRSRRGRNDDRARRDSRDSRDSREPRGREPRGRGQSARPSGRRNSEAPAGAQRSSGASSIVQGVLTMTPRGFGFVAAEDGGPDIFIPPPSVGPAMHGDRVEVSTRPSPKGREGEVFGILDRRNVRITGTLVREAKAIYLEADDLRLRSPMPVEGELPADAKPGLAIIAEIVRFPQSGAEAATVRVIEALGVQGTTRVEVAKIKIREGILEEFPPEVLEEAEAIPNAVPQRDKKGREDLRDRDLVTIDPPDARDFDDALWAERRDEGGYRIIVAIADVSHYVRPGTAIDREAVERSTSIYLPDRAIPMLPAELSSNLASLVPHRDRLCLAVEVELSERGKIESYRYIDGLMRSGARLTYGGAAKALGLTEEGPTEKAAEERLEMLTTLLEASRALRKKRMKRGALDFDLPEPKVVLDEDGVEPIDVVRSRKDPGVREAYRLVEEMALLANEVVAADLTERGVPAIYRTHGSPDLAKLETFAQLATSLGYELEPEDAQDPKKLAKFLTRIDGTSQAPVLRYLLLRAMQQAVYDTTPSVGHFGLAAKDYLHFTSPIRRYPDLAVHRIVRKVIRGESIDGASLGPKLRGVAVKGSLLERRAMSVERDVVNLYRTVIMRDRVGEEFDATVSGVDPQGFYCSLAAPFVDVRVPVERLDDDYYELDGLGIRLTGATSGRSFALGDPVRVHLLDVNIQRREMIATPTDVLARGGSSEGGRSKRRGRDGAKKRGPSEGRKRRPANSKASTKRKRTRD